MPNPRGITKSLHYLFNLVNSHDREQYKLLKSTYRKWVILTAYARRGFTQHPTLVRLQQEFMEGFQEIMFRHQASVELERRGASNRRHRRDTQRRIYYLMNPEAGRLLNKRVDGMFRRRGYQ